MIAAEFEAKASKITSYVSTWERATPDERNRMLILALAERVAELEARG